MDHDTPVVILCGGQGTRIREVSERLPKAMVDIGGRPILWHIMKLYSHYGYRRFILCLGYKGWKIKQFFLDYRAHMSDFTLTLSNGDHEPRFHNAVADEDWEITFAETGPSTPTGGRVAKIAKYLDADTFCVTYGDGLSDVDLDALLAFHRAKKKTATLTAIHPMSPFGVIEAKQGLAQTFKEKPRLAGLINGGFFVFNKRIFDALRDDSILEEAPLRGLASKGDLAVYEHDGFWMCMDTFKDVERLNQMWEKGDRPWVTWR